MLTLDPYGENTLYTAAAFYECWECDLCPPPPDDPYPGGREIFA